MFTDASKSRLMLMLMNEMDTANLSFMIGYDEAKSFTSDLVSEHSKDAYLAEVNASLRCMLGHLYNTSRFTDESLNTLDKLQVKLDIKDDLVANCECYLSEDNDHELTVSITTGILHALNDLAARALSSENFMNERAYSNIGDVTSRWKGCKCFAAVPLYPPKHRYFDYRQDGSPCIEGSAFYSNLERTLGIPSGSFNPSYIGTFYKKMPDDYERLSLSLHLIDIALFWIFMHEEAHYREGHMLYQGNMPFNGISEDANKALEAQADMVATAAIFDRYFKLDNIQGFSPSWIQGYNGLFRIITGGIALAISILDRKHRIIGKDANYPSPRTRFALALRKLIDDGAKKIDEGHSVEIKNNLIYTTPSREFYKSCWEWVYGAFYDFYTISEIIAEEDSDESSIDIELIVEDIDFVTHVSVTELMFSHPDMKKAKDTEYLEIKGVLEVNEKLKIYVDKVRSEFGNWDELHEIIATNNEIYTHEVRRYQTETFGSLKNVEAD